MKKGWTTKRLGDVCEVVNGGTPKTSVAAYWGGEHLWITPAEMGKRDSPYADDTERKLTDAGLRDSSARMLPPSSVILSSRAPIGHLVINVKPMATNQGCKGLIPGSQLEHKFLFYYLSSIVELLDSLGTGATFRELSGGKLREVLVPVPPLAEQQRIVGVLDEAFAGLATAEANAAKNLQDARAIFDSHLNTVFTHRGEGWKDMRLSELCDIRHGYAFEGEFFSSRGDYVLLTPGNFFETGGYRDRHEKQKYFVGKVPPEFVLRRGDMLVAMTEQAAGLLGSPIIVPDSGRFLHNQRLGLVVAKPNAPWLNTFFFHVFNLPAVRQAIHDSASGAKVRHTSPAKIGAVRVPVPPIAEQGRIVTQLDALLADAQRLTRLYGQKQAALAELKKSLLHQAFSGNL